MFVLSFIDESRKTEVSTNETTGKTSKKAPRPKNAFILYRREKQKYFKSNFRSIHSKDLSRIIGKMWRNETQDVIRTYERLAEEEKLQHISKYPLYKYAPKQKKKVKCTQNTASNSTETEKLKHVSQTVDASTQANSYDILNEIDMFACEYSDVFEEVPPEVLDPGYKKAMANESMRITQHNEPSTVMSSSTLPSALINDMHILPDTSNLDIFTLDDFEYESLLVDNVY
jgi:hypothetical protein